MEIGSPRRVGRACFLCPGAEYGIWESRFVFAEFVFLHRGTSSRGGWLDGKGGACYLIEPVERGRECQLGRPGPPTEVGARGLRPRTPGPGRGPRSTQVDWGQE